MESWQHVWREGVAPILSREAIVALQKALQDDDPRLVQGYTALPCEGMLSLPEKCEGACLIGFTGLREYSTVGEVWDHLELTVALADSRLGGQGSCAPLLVMWDDTPREEARLAMLQEVELVLSGKVDA